MSYLVDLTFLPLVGAVVVAAMPAAMTQAIRRLALGVSVLTFLIAVPLAFETPTSGYRHETHASWISSLGVSMHMGVDGISALLVLLTTLTVPIVLLSAESHIKDPVKEFLALMLAMETGMLGV